MVRGIRLVTLACLWLVPTLILSTAFASDWSSVWETVRVPAWGVSFMDIRSITSGVKTLQKGGDPLVANASDPFHRPMNYPRIWLYLFSGLGISDSNVRVVGITFCVLYLICISWLILRSESNLGAVVLLLGGMSLAPLLALERGNTDLFVFSIVFLGCVTTNKYLKLGAYFSAAALKIFPFVALIVDALRRPRKERIAPIAFAGLAILLFAWQWRDLNAIRHGTPVSVYLSYGVLSLKAQTAYLSTALFACSAVAVVLIAGIAWRIRPKLDESLLNSKSGELFLIFGGIYAFTFAIGSNWNYRLIFLVPTLPFAIDLLREHRNAKWGVFYIVSAIAAENSFVAGVYQGIPLGDVATFMVFAMILVILLEGAKNSLVRARVSFRAPTGATTAHERGIG